jgi:hypothetical protein
MLKLKVAQKEEGPVVELRLISEKDEVRVEDANSEFSIVGFRVVDGKVNLFRYTAVKDGNYKTDNKGRIVEVDEYKVLRA